MGQGYDLSLPNGRCFKLEVTERADKKMIRLLTGLGDGCDICTVSPLLWSDVEQVEIGFPPDRNIGIYVFFNLVNIDSN